MSFNAKPPPTIYDIHIASLLFSGAVEFGSRPLGVATKDSDYDFAILRSNYVKLMENRLLPEEINIKKHFTVVPKKGLNTIVTSIKIKDEKTLDLLILERQEDIDTIKISIDYIKSKYSSEILSNKQLRINLYASALLSHGFKTTNYLMNFLHTIGIKSQFDIT